MPKSVINLKKLFQFSKDDKVIKFIVMIGLAGIVLIFLSDVLFKGGGNAASSQTVTVSSAEVEKALEGRMSGIISSISGAGKTKVMITLEQGVENVYQSDKKRSSDVTYNSNGTNSQKLEERVSNEENIIIIEDANGAKQALIIKSIQPIVKGVVVVCEGGDDVRVKEKVIAAVVTALGITSNRVCVSKLA